MAIVSLLKNFFLGLSRKLVRNDMVLPCLHTALLPGGEHSELEVFGV